MNRRRVHSWGLGVLLLASLAWTSTAGALTHESRLPDAGPQDQNARSLHVLEYHPYPDPLGDTWGFPVAEKNGTRVGYMEAAYDAYWFPTVVVDGLVRVEGATTFRDAFDAYEGAYLDRRGEDAPIRLALWAGLMPDGVGVSLDVRAKRDLGETNLTLRVVLFEDEVRFDGGNGVKEHRFTVRAVAHDAPVALEGTANRSVMARVGLDPSWNVERLGFVASVHNRDAASTEFEPDEVLQATTIRLDQSGPTIQYSRGVLVEVLTATWCAACVYGDGAIHELTNFYGHPSSKYLDRPWTYLRPPDAVAAAGAVAAGLAVLVLATRPRRPTA